MRVHCWIFSIFVAGAFIFGGDARAQSWPKCPKIKGGAKISLDFDPGRIVYDDTISRRQLARMSKLTPNSDRHKNNATMGMTNVHYTTEFKGQAQGATRGPNRACARLKSVSMRVVIRELKIFILGDYAPGSCQYDTILAHEHQHAEIARTTLRDNLVKIRRRLRFEVDRLGEVRDISVKRAFDTAFNRLRVRMKPVLDDMGRDLKRANAALDSPESYAQFNARCRSWRK